MIILRRYGTLLGALLLASMGISLAILSGVGLPAFDAFNQAVAETLNMQVGDIVMYVQIFFVSLQLLILRKDATWSILLQIPFVILLGQFINLFVYVVFGNLVLEGYVLRVLVFIFSQVWTSFFISIILVLDIVAMPLEKFSLIVSERGEIKFGYIRQGIDVLLIALALGLTFFAGAPLTIREGTIIAALTFGPLMGLYMPRIVPHFIKWELIQS